MDKGKQKKRSQVKHEEAIEEKKTCIDCHKGIAHKAVHAGEDSESGKPATTADAAPAAKG
jgi:cytochrome c-type protein NapC